MRRKISLLLAGIMLLGMLTACVPSTNNDTSAKNDPPASDSKDDQQSTEATVPSRTDINIALPSAGNSMDPHNSGLAVDIQVQYQIFDGLYNTNDRSELIPAIAESHEISADGTTYTFHLRDDVLFHNGEALTSADVVWSFERAMTSAQMATYVAPIVSVTAPNDYTVEIKLTAPYAPFLLYSTRVKIINQKAVEEAGDLFGGVACLCGTGPYYMEEYDVNLGLTLKAFPNYYKGEAAIKQINYTVVADTSTALIAFQSGEFDYCSVPAANWDEIKAVGEYTTEVADSAKVYYFALNVNADRGTPLSNKLVRQAIQYAIDKEGLVLITRNGLGVPADHLARVGFLADAYETDFTYSYDPDKARELLAEAGYSDGCYIGEIQCSAAFTKVGEALQAQLADVGIQADIKSGETASMVVDWRASNYDSLANSVTVSFTYDNIRRYNYSQIETVFMKYNTNPDIDYQKIDELFDAGVIETNEEKRKEIYIELEEMLLDEAAYVPLYYDVAPYAWDPDLNAYGYYSIYYVYDWSWN